MAAEEELSGLDKALVAWGVKAAPGEEPIDLKEKIKSAGVAGAAAYGLTELLFWVVSIPLAVLTYHQTTGEWLDLTSGDGQAKAFAVSAGFLTVARLVVPLRIAAALALTPAMDKYVIKQFAGGQDAEASLDDDEDDPTLNSLEDAQPEGLEFQEAEKAEAEQGKVPVQM